MAAMETEMDSEETSPKTIKGEKKESGREKSEREYDKVSINQPALH